MLATNGTTAASTTQVNCWFVWLFVWLCGCVVVCVLHVSGTLPTLLRPSPSTNVTSSMCGSDLLRCRCALPDAPSGYVSSAAQPCPAIVAMPVLCSCHGHRDERKLGVDGAYVCGTKRGWSVASVILFAANDGVELGSTLPTEVLWVAPASNAW